MLKQFVAGAVLAVVGAAAFGRLCVETQACSKSRLYLFAAAFGRLCVETLSSFYLKVNMLAAAFGRLCVETFAFSNKAVILSRSRLRAAVC